MKTISEAVIRRLPKYYRQLRQLEKKGVVRISSRELSELMGFNASQIRQDFNCFGGFGQQGFGYKVENLVRELENILALQQEYTAAIVGLGNIGQALVHYEGFARECKIIAAFDIDERIIGTVVNGIRVQDVAEMEEVLKEQKADIGVICTPLSAAQETAEKLARCGVAGIWNFAPIDLYVPGVCVENVQLSDGLHVLTYRMNEKRKQ